jgi:hypothetical protein
MCPLRSVASLLFSLLVAGPLTVVAQDNAVTNGQTCHCTTPHPTNGRSLDRRSASQLNMSGLASIDNTPQRHTSNNVQWSISTTDSEVAATLALASVNTLSITRLTVSERAVAWLLAILLTPWLLGSLIQYVFRSGSFLLQGAIVAAWMAAVVGSSWYLWGYAQPFAFTLFAMPLLGISTPYFAFVCDRIDPLTISG